MISDNNSGGKEDCTGIKKPNSDYGFKLCKRELLWYQEQH